MPLFKNRIPRNSVSFSAEPYELPLLVAQNMEKEEEVVEETVVEKSEYEIQLENSYAQLEIEQQKLLKEQRNIEEEKRNIEEEKRNIEEVKQSIALEKEQLEQVRLQYKQEFEVRKHELEKEKMRMYYDISEFIWDQPIEIAENIIHQTIKTDQISIIPLLEGTIKQLPVSFEKLSVIVHPETVEKLKEENNGTKTHWLIENLEWKYDLSLQLGEFIIEEEKEFFEYRFQEIFQMLRKQLDDRKYLGGEDGD